MRNKHESKYFAVLNHVRNRSRKILNRNRTIRIFYLVCIAVGTPKESFIISRLIKLTCNTVSHSKLIICSKMYDNPYHRAICYVRSLVTYEQISFTENQGSKTSIAL